MASSHLVPAATVTTGAKPHGQQQLARDLGVFLLSASGGWVKIKLELPLLLPRMYQIHVFRFNPRSRCNSSSRCWYRAREHVLFYFFAVPEIFLFLSDNSSLIMVAYLVHRVVYVLHYTVSVHDEM